MSNGRPSSYNQEIANKICEQIATSSRSLRTICNEKDMPSVSTVLNWLRVNIKVNENDEKEEGFLTQYTRAKEEQADMMAEEMLDIADTTEEGTIIETDDNGRTKEKKGDMLGHRKLKIETRKWLASKLKPKKYGEKLDLNTVVQNLPPILEPIPLNETDNGSLEDTEVK